MTEPVPMDQPTTPPPLPPAPPHEAPPSNVTHLPFQTPEFNMADEVVNDLTEQLAQQAKQLSMARANVKQLTGIIKANKDLLGLVEDSEGNLAPAPQGPPPPPPNRATRRARPKK